MTDPKPERTEHVDEPPPILGSWSALYWLLIAELALLTLCGVLLGWWWGA